MWLLLLSLIGALAVAWAALAVVRERAIVMQLHVERALGERFWTDQLNRQTTQHNRAIEHCRRGTLPSLLDGPVEVEPTPLPEWALNVVSVETVEDGEHFHYRSTAGRALASVPAWFFHGAFAVGLAVLTALSVVEGR